MNEISQIDDLSKFRLAIYIDGDPNGSFSIPSKAELRAAAKLIGLFGHLKVATSGRLKAPEEVDNEVMTHFVTLEGGLTFLLG